ncbi:hypothetical protein SEA_RENNA12_70 [Arthrobacter phage Renna12]|nr:hypothetical protein SEA_RENNA12_70 [Arthrobacter phage Renna12]
MRRKGYDMLTEHHGIEPEERERWRYCGVVEWCGLQFHMWAGPSGAWVAQWDWYRLMTLGAGAV